MVRLSFDDANLPANVTIVGTATIPGDGSLHLTDVTGSGGQGGSIVITNLETQPVSGFTLHTKVRVGGGTTPPADGFSVVWATAADIPTNVAFGEDGVGSGLIISFDIFDNGSETPPAPSIDARWKGQLIGTVHLPYQQMETGDQFADLDVRLESDGTLDLQYKGMVIFNNLQLPGFTPLTDAAFAIGARTGGLEENQWIDDLQIATSTGPASSAPEMSISRSADGTISVSWTGTGTLQATDTLGGTWAPVNGASNPYTAPNDRQMRFFRVAQP